jgi:Na+/melibiose symporter-like transporter
MMALLNPGAVADERPLAAWLAVWLTVTYLGFSMASIAYQAWGAQLSDHLHERTRVTAAREIFTLIGVVAAAALPAVLGGENATGLGRFGLAFTGLLAVCAAVTLAWAPRPPRRGRTRASLVASVAAPLANPEYRRLLAVFMLSGIAAAIPSTLVLFFIADVLQAPDLAGVFLVVYFLAGALGMPVWVYASRRIGKEHAWIAGMTVAVVAFVWAWRLGPGDVMAYGAICILSGLALGADLALPASILADVIDRDRRGPGAAAEGSYFGIWNLVTKANLAIAAGLALPALDALGYAPGEPGAARSLALVYCLLPCAFKLGSAAALWFMPVRGPLALAKGVT